MKAVYLRANELEGLNALLEQLLASSQLKSSFSADLRDNLVADVRAALAVGDLGGWDYARRCLQFRQVHSIRTVAHVVLAGVLDREPRDDIVPEVLREIDEFAVSWFDAYFNGAGHLSPSNTMVESPTSYQSTQKQKLRQKPTLLALPEEILAMSLSRLAVADVMAASQVCRKLRALSLAKAHTRLWSTIDMRCPNIPLALRRASDTDTLDVALDFTSKHALSPSQCERVLTVLQSHMHHVRTLSLTLEDEDESLYYDTVKPLLRRPAPMLQSFRLEYNPDSSGARDALPHDLFANAAPLLTHIAFPLERLPVVSGQISPLRLPALQNVSHYDSVLYLQRPPDDVLPAELFLRLLLVSTPKLKKLEFGRPFREDVEHRAIRLVDQERFALLKRFAPAEGTLESLMLVCCDVAGAREWELSPTLDVFNFRSVRCLTVVRPQPAREVLATVLADFNTVEMRLEDVLEEGTNVTLRDARGFDRRFVDVGGVGLGILLTEYAVGTTTKMTVTQNIRVSTTDRLRKASFLGGVQEFTVRLSSAPPPPASRLNWTVVLPMQLGEKAAWWSLPSLVKLRIVAGTQAESFVPEVQVHSAVRFVREALLRPNLEEVAFEGVCVVGKDAVLKFDSNIVKRVTVF